MKQKIVVILAILGIVLGAWVAYQWYFVAMPQIASFKDRRNVTGSEMIQIFENATKTDDMTLCEQIAQEDLRKSCKYYFLLSQQGDSLSLADCKTLDDSARRDACIITIAGRGRVSDPSTCETELEGLPAKAQCYAYLAAFGKDTSICENIPINKTIPGFRDNCYTGVARATASKSPCINIVDNSEKQISCEIQAAIGAGNPDWCGEISEESFRDFCYHQVAVSLEDSEICDRIANNEVLDWCKEDVLEVA